MSARSIFMRDIIRPIGLALLAPGFGSLLAMILMALLDWELSTIVTSAITFLFAAAFAFYLFPRVAKLPFGEVSLSDFLHRLGFYWPAAAWKHVLLGAMLAGCTLVGMWVGSLFTGRYEPDWSTVNFTHTIFSINPGLWEEFFYRGVIMFVLLSAAKSVRRAAFIQILIFGLGHVKGLDLWAWVDVLSVLILAIAFTYAAHKTGTLVAGIVFHFLHDTFLFLPQVPGRELQGASEAIPFYLSLWLMVGVGCLLVRFSADRLGVSAGDPLYVFERSRAKQGNVKQ